MKTIKKISIICIILYALLLSYLMLFGLGRGFIHPEYMYNLKPFHTIESFLHINRFNPSIWVTNLIGNVCAFIPFGIMLPIIMERKFIKSILIFLVGIVTLEFLQLITRRGSFDIDDIILNSLGFLVGFVFMEVVRLLIRKRRGID